MTAFLIYFLIGVGLFTYGSRNEHAKSLLEQLTPQQYILIFILFGLFWLPAFLVILFCFTGEDEEMFNNDNNKRNLI